MKISIKPFENDHFLDKIFQSAIFPYRILQHAVFLSRFAVDNNCIRPHRLPYLLFSFFGVLLFIGFQFLTSYFVHKNGNQAVINFTDVNVTFLIISFITFYSINVIYRKDNVAIIVKIQKAYGAVNFRRYKQAIYWNYFGVFRHFVFYSVCIILMPDVNIAIYFYSIIYFDVYVTYGTSLMSFIRHGVETWISEVEFYCSIERDIEDEANGVFKKLYQAYMDLMDAFCIFKRLFQFSTLYHVVDTFIHSLVFLQTVIEMNRRDIYVGKYNVRHFAQVAVLWAFKNLLFVSMFSFYCEKFYISINEANAACSRLQKQTNMSKQAKRLCKNVQRFNRAAFRKMTACNIFTVDASMAEMFNRLEVEYIVIVLQFAFL